MASQIASAAVDTETRSSARPSIGVMGGWMKPNHGLSGRFNYGLEIAFQPQDPWSLGLQIYTSKKTDAFGNSNTITPLLLKGVYNYGSSMGMSNFYMGAKTGIAWLSGSSSLFNVSATSTSFAIGPVVGADYNLCPQFSMGAEVAYLFLLASGSPDHLTADALLKYWF